MIYTPKICTIQYKRSSAGRIFNNAADYIHANTFPQKFAKCTEKSANKPTSHSHLRFTSKHSTQNPTRHKKKPKSHFKNFLMSRAPPKTQQNQTNPIKTQQNPTKSRR
ncbi:hypothetical protein M758_6G019700 [Ceratodon purpureus]|uniref:Uncharacterized protein n=1 Tax=Ceratodon purpureus TaxID=3225 RepID=A0A8T0H9A6_CERPU|nr:hypothetical protein KC19_6G022200 [Ceratodon purpureus]KAG0612338.1 hypothetical protein M758_6G019700 [Ceratodon purpureus]